MASCEDCKPPGTNPMWRCIDGTCSEPACDLQDFTVTLCPGKDATFHLPFTCTNPCPADEALAITVDGQVPEEISTSFNVHGAACGVNQGIGYVTVPLSTPLGEYIIHLKGTGVGDAECFATLTVNVFGPDIEFVGVSEKRELTPGCVVDLNDDDDDLSDVPDYEETEVLGYAVLDEDDLRPVILTVPDYDPAGTVTLNHGVGVGKIKVYEEVPPGGPYLLRITTWPRVWGPGLFPDPARVWIEGVQVSSGAADVAMSLTYQPPNATSCTDRIRMTVFNIEMDEVTSGTDPVPVNPAITAPSFLTPMNTFHLTRVQPDIDLVPFNASWTYHRLNGSDLPGGTGVLISSDGRGIRFNMPVPSGGVYGSGELCFYLGNEPDVAGPSPPSACASTLLRNVQPDTEPGDYRLTVKCHLCVSSDGTIMTNRTVAEVVAAIGDASLILSQCGVIIGLATYVSYEVVADDLVNNSTTSTLTDLFSVNEAENAIDIYFIKSINSGLNGGFTKTPRAVLQVYEPGIAIADTTLDGPLIGQAVARTLAHEITHYMLNNFGGDGDHRANETDNLMWPGVDGEKRDLDASQCLEMRSDYEVD